MKSTSWAAVLGGLLTVCLIQSVARAEPPEAGSSKAELNPTAMEDQARQVFSRYCASCHGPKKHEGEVRLDALETIDPVDRQILFGKVQDVIHLGEMPPEEAKQPSDAERKILLRWLTSQLTGDVAKALAEKLNRFEYGNVVTHDDLFSGKHADLPGYTYDRRWMVSEYIFNEKVNRLLDYHPRRAIYGKTVFVAGDSGIHWSPKTEHGNKFRRTITNPFLLPEKVGVRYSGHEAITAGHLLTMMGNVKRIAGHMASEQTVKAEYPATHALMQTEFEHRETLRSREQFLTTHTYMDHLLKDIYGEEHESLLPKVVRQDVKYPPVPMSKGKPRKRTENLGILYNQDKDDLLAIFRGIVSYKQPPFAIQEVVTDERSEDREDWRPYSEEDQAEYEAIILKSERDWFIRGIPESRIRNRIVAMKAFFIAWDLNLIYERAQSDEYKAPAYRPRDDAEMAIITKALREHRKAGDTYQQVVDRCMADWKAQFKSDRNASASVDDAALNAILDELYVRISERKPTKSERSKYLALLKSYLDKLEPQPAITKLIESLILSTEYVYRNEFGVGDADEHGRRMLSSRDASYSLAYALTDSSPDAELVNAVEQGRLVTREDYEREVRRMLERRDRWTIIDESVQAANINPSVTNQSIRKLRFFRDFFGYPKALKVFKDDSRFGAGSHERAVSRLIDEADLLVEHILEEDERVFETLLTTDKFYVFHNGDNRAMKAASDEFRNLYDYFKDKGWEDWQPEDIAPHVAFLKRHWEFQREKDGDLKGILKKLHKLMAGLELHFSEGQSSGLPYMKNGMGFWHGGPVLGRTGQQMRGEEVTTYWNLDWRSWDYPTRQPATIPNRKGILTHPAWLIAHAQNLETDPIHRGKWVQEKLLAGTIPDVPITVDAVIDPDHTKTMRQRMEIKTRADYCWRCHQKMDPLGLPFELFDDFGRYRTEENLEHPENLIKKAPDYRAPIEELTYGARLPVYKTLPVDPRGVLEGTGDSKLDGEVEDAFDLIDRLAKSDKVRQSIIRHAFRYFLGRNETLSDSKTLIDAERAYLDSNGSFDELIVSLLTSDSFIYRKPHSKD